MTAATASEVDFINTSEDETVSFSFSGLSGERERQPDRREARQFVEGDREKEEDCPLKAVERVDSA
jgi:hypothetical protein